MANIIMLLQVTRLRDNCALYGPALPISVAGMAIHSEIRGLFAPVSDLAQSRTVPISRGSPPALE